METLKVTLTGSSPMIVHNIRLANPLDPIVKEIKAITGKRKKTDDDHAAIAKLEWLGGLYYDDKVGPFVPGINIDATLVSAAKLSKRGPDAKRGLMTVDDKIPIEYTGPRDPDKMFADGRFVDMRAVRVQAARTMRCRPIFHDWRLRFDLAYDPEVWNRPEVVELLVVGGRLVGLNEYRPRFGRYASEVAN